MAWRERVAAHRHRLLRKVRLPFPLFAGSRSKHGPEPGPEVVELVEEMECVHLINARGGEAAVR